MLLQKEAHENRRISRNELMAETGIAHTTILRWERNEIVKFDASVVEALCVYFGCDVGDLLYLEHLEDEVESAE
jgi:putative transcriptional regulator